MSSATTFWRIAGMNYVQMSAVSTTAVRKALKEPMKSMALSRDAVFYNRTVFVEGKQLPKKTVTSLAEAVAN